QRTQIDVAIVHAVTAHIDLTLIDDLKVIYAPQSRAFARAALPNDGHHLPFGNRKRHAFQHLVGAKAFMNVFQFNHYRHSFSFTHSVWNVRRTEACVRACGSTPTRGSTWQNKTPLSRHRPGRAGKWSC